MNDRSLCAVVPACCLAAGCGSLSGGPAVDAPAVVTRDVDWQGWKAIEQTNGLITLRHVPDAGGRTLSLEIGGDDAFLVFPNERGRCYSVDGRPASVHFGGHYVCIGPETMWSVHEQPFNPHGGPHEARRQIERADCHEVSLVSRPGTSKNATVSMERRIVVRSGSTHITVDEVVTNHGTDPLEFYIWDFTQIDAADHRKPAPHPLRRLSFYVPVPVRDGRKQYTVFMPRDPAKQGQFDETLPTDVLAIHYAAEQFKIASHAEQWWIAAVDHDTGWTYVKVFDADSHARHVDGNGPIEVYGSFMTEPAGQPFVEMELLGGIRRCARGESVRHRESWYACICKGPVLEFSPAGVVCEQLAAVRQGGGCRVTGRFGVFRLGTARLRLVDGDDKTLWLSEPMTVDPRVEFRLDASVPPQKKTTKIILEITNQGGEKTGVLGRVGFP